MNSFKVKFSSKNNLVLKKKARGMQKALNSERLNVVVDVRGV